MQQGTTTKRFAGAAAIAALLLAGALCAPRGRADGPDAQPGTPAERQQAREALRKKLADDVRKLDAFSNTFREVASLVNPSVVNIRVAKDAAHGARDEAGDQDESAPGGGAPQFVEQGEGSGVIVSDDGLILTNNHVVGGAAEK